MVGWHHRLNGHESEHTLGDSEGQGRLACCCPWGHKAADRTERLTTEMTFVFLFLTFCVADSRFVHITATSRHFSGSDQMVGGGVVSKSRPGASFPSCE